MSGKTILVSFFIFRRFDDFQRNKAILISIRSTAVEIDSKIRFYLKGNSFESGLCLFENN